MLYLYAHEYKLSIDMSKTTMGNKLPRKLEQKMQTVGEQIKHALQLDDGKHQPF